MAKKKEKEAERLEGLAYRLELDHAYHFQADQRSALGYVESFTAGNTTLTADITLVDPMKKDYPRSATIVGMIESFSWSGAASDEIRVDFVVSSANRQSLMPFIMRQDPSQNTASISFTIYDFDDIKKKYFKAVHTNSQAVSGILATTNPGSMSMQGSSGSVRYELSVQSESVKIQGAGDSLPSRIWKVQATIKPGSSSTQKIHHSSAALQKTVVKWGVPTR